MIYAGPRVSRLNHSGTLDRYIGAVAQLVAHLHGMQGVRGSSPLSSTMRVNGAALSFDVGTKAPSTTLVKRGGWRDCISSL